MPKAITKSSTGTTTSVQTFNDEVYNAITKGENKDKLAKLFEFAENVEDENLAEQGGGQVLKFEDHGRYILIALGTEQTVIKGDPTTVAKLMDKDGKEYINWDRMLVSAVSSLKQVPQMIVVDYEDDVVGAKGTYKKLKVSVINPNKNEKKDDLPF